MPTNSLPSRRILEDLIRAIHSQEGGEEEEEQKAGRQRVGEGGGEYQEYIPLCNAALNGNWNAARDFLEHHPEALNGPISDVKETAFHIAVAANQFCFIQKLLERVEPEALLLQDNRGDTALVQAIITGDIRIVEALVTKNPSLANIPDNEGTKPIVFAAMYSRKDILLYLWNRTKEDDQDPTPYTPLLLNLATSAGFYDISLQILQRCPRLAVEVDENDVHLLMIMATKPADFPSGCHLLTYWQRFIYLCIPIDQVDASCHSMLKSNIETLPQSSKDIAMAKSMQYTSMSQVYQQLIARFWRALINLAAGVKEVYDTKLTHKQASKLVQVVSQIVSTNKHEPKLQMLLSGPMLRPAIENGIVELVAECIQIFPTMIWLDSNERNLLQLAVQYRQEKVFNFINGMHGYANVLARRHDKLGTNILHLAANLAPSSRLNILSGAALQMQRELQWFKEVEKIVPPQMKEKKLLGETPKSLFTKEHKGLVEKGEKWMKDTAQSCMVVATLIATVVFASIFTVPGGNINDVTSKDNGFPVFLSSNTFMLFVISDAVALFSSLTSVLVFLSILTSRYAEEDFLKSLPKRLIIGLATLFLSIGTMMIAFGAALYILLSKRVQGVFIPITLVACIPMFIFALLQFPLFVQVVNSTYRFGIFNVKR